MFARFHIFRKTVRKESLPPPRPPTPLPDYVSQFDDCDWFQKFFPSATRKVICVLYFR